MVNISYRVLTQKTLDLSLAEDLSFERQDADSRGHQFQMFFKKPKKIAIH